MTNPGGTCPSSHPVDCFDGFCCPSGTSCTSSSGGTQCQAGGSSPGTPAGDGGGGDGTGDAGDEGSFDGADDSSASDQNGSLIDPRDGESRSFCRAGGTGLPPVGLLLLVLGIVKRRRRSRV